MKTLQTLLLILSLFTTLKIPAQDCNIEYGDTKDYTAHVNDAEYWLDPGMGGGGGTSYLSPYDFTFYIDKIKVKKVHLRYRYDNETEWRIPDPKVVDFDPSHFGIGPTGTQRVVYDLPKTIPPFTIEYQTRAQCANEVWTAWEPVKSEHFGTGVQGQENALVGCIKSIETTTRAATFNFNAGAIKYFVRLIDNPDNNQILRADQNDSPKSLTFEDLTPDTEYEYELKLELEGGIIVDWTYMGKFETDCGRPIVDEITVATGFPALTVYVDYPAYHYQFRLREKGQSSWRLSPVLFVNSYRYENISKSITYEIQARISCSPPSGLEAINPDSYMTDWSNTKEHFIPQQCPQPAGDIGAKNISNNSATLYCTPPNDGSVEKFVFRYRLSNTSDWRVRSSDTKSVEVSNLVDGSEYVMQVQYDCGNGVTGNWSVMKFFTTDNCNSVSRAQFTHQNVNYTHVQFKSLTSRHRYIWKYRKSGTQNATELPETDLRTLKITGLTDGTSYEFALKVGCDPSYSAWSDWNTFSTLTCEIPPYSIRETDITNSSVILSFSSPTGLVDWQYRKAGNTNWITVESRTGETQIDSLTANTVYEYRMRYVCNREQGANSDWSEQDNFITRCDATINRFSNVGLTSITVQLTNSRADGYELRYRIRNTSNWTEIISIPNTIVVNNLLQGTEYEFQASGICPNQTGFWSSSSFMSTNAARLAQCDSPHISQVQVLNIRSNQFTVSCTRSNVLSYQFRYSALPTTTGWIVLPETNNDEHTFTGLNSNTYHAVSVRVKCSSNVWSAWSAPVFAQTTNVQAFSNFSCFSPTLSEIIATQVSSQSARLNCTVSSLKYQFRMLDTTGNDTIITYSAVDTSYIILSKLKPNTTYYFQCRIWCNNAYGSYSPKRIFRTQSSNECKQPVKTEFYAYEITSQSATIGCTQAVSGYQFRWRKTKDFYWDESDTQVQPFIELSELDPGEKYEYQVRTICSSGQPTGYSELKSFVTNTVCNPVPMKALKVTPLQNQSVQLSVNLLSEYYFYRYRIRGQLLWIELPVTNEPIQGISNLKKDSIYEFQVKLYCSASQWTPWSASEEILNSSTSLKSKVDFSTIVYPNPASQELHLQISNDYKFIQYQIFNYFGQVVLHGKLSSKSINVHTLNSGIYFLNLKIDKLISVTKFEISK